MNKETSQRTAAALGVMFGTKAPRVRFDVSRNKPIITRKDKHGFAFRMLSFNEAKALLAAERKVFESDADLEKALWRGTKLRDGGMLRDSYYSRTNLPTKYADD